VTHSLDFSTFSTARKSASISIGRFAPGGAGSVSTC
jgi:hypothetical protein